MSEHPLRFLDCNCGVGPSMGGPGPGCDGSIATLLRTMDSLGIAEACPFALAEYDGNPGTGNAWLDKAVTERERLHPVLVIGPNACGEFIAAADLAGRMRASGARMLRLPLAPLAAQKELDVSLIEDLLDAMAEHRIPLIVDCLTSLEQVRTSEVVAMLRGWPTSHLILSFPKLGTDDRRFYALWDRFEHFHVDLPGYQTLGAIEDVTRRFGSQRIVFGTRYPHFTPLQTMLQVIYSDVDEAAKRDIAGETIRRLLREVQL